MTIQIKPCPDCGGFLRTALLDPNGYEIGVECQECPFVDDTTDGYVSEETPVLEVCS